MGKYENKRIGILGGTFNPIHNGHLHIAKQILKRLHLDKIIFVPVYIPPHKKIRGNATTSDRLQMLRLAVGGKKRFIISLYEIRRKDKSYSVKSARFFKKSYGKKTKLFFLIGADSLSSLKKWKNISSLLKLVQFVVVPRPGFKMKCGSLDILKINVSGKDISSTRIRRLIKNQKPVARLVPKKVYLYIKKRKLYK